MNMLLGSPEYLNGTEYWWVPRGGRWEIGGSTTMVRTESRPTSPGSVGEMLLPFSFAWHDEDTFCYWRKPGMITTLGWLVNVFLNQHQPTGDIIGLSETTLVSGRTCASVENFGSCDTGPDSTFDRMQVQMCEGNTLSDTAFGCAMCTAQYIAYWRSTGLAGL